MLLIGITKCVISSHRINIYYPLDILPLDIYDTIYMCMYNVARPLLLPFIPERSPLAKFLSIFLKGDERSMEICSCYSKSGEAGIRVIRPYRDFIGFRPSYSFIGSL